MGDSLYVAFDFGLSFIGVAVGQTTTQQATALTHLIAKQGIPDWVKIDQLIAQWKPKGLVVGWPLNVDGTTQRLNKKTQGFIKALKRRYDLPVYRIDERYTTVEAKHALYTQGGTKALSKKNIDSYAAKLICESYLRYSLDQ